MHDIHCPQCGRKFKADELAFDFGRLVLGYIKRQSEKAFGATFDWLTLNKIELKLYLSINDLITQYGFDPEQKVNNFEFTAQHLIDHMLSVVKANVRKKDLLPDQDMLDSLRSNPSSPYYEVLYPIFGKAGAESYDIAVELQEILSQLASSPKDIIAEFDVQAVYTKDDEDHPYANSLIINYSPKDRVIVNQIVCKGDVGAPCGKEIYGWAGKYEEIVIGLAGTARTGKTAYLASLLSVITRESNMKDGKLGSQQNVIANIAYEGEAYSSFKDDIIRPYITGTKIKKTVQEGFNSSDVVPLFSLTFNIKRPDGNSSKGKSYIFTFVDIPGEAYAGEHEDEQNYIINDKKILQHARAFWFCITPSQIVGANVEATLDQVDLEIQKRMEKMSSIIASVKDTKVPTAVLITRADEINGIIDEKTGLDFKTELVKSVDYDNNSNNYNFFSNQALRPEDTFDSNSPWMDNKGNLYYDSMLDFSKASYRFLNQRGLPEAIRVSFGRFSPFAVASYGYNVSNATVQKAPMPSMIEAPFLWTLGSLGISPVLSVHTKFDVEDSFWGRLLNKMIEVKTFKPINIEEEKEFNQLFISELEEW